MSNSVSDEKVLFEPEDISNHPHVHQSYLNNLSNTISDNFASLDRSLHSTQIIIFVVDNKEFRCIRPLFAMHSDLLTKVLYPKDPNNYTMLINVNDIGFNIPCSSFEIIQKWCYGIDAEISLDSIIDILVWSNVFKMNGLENLCKQFFDKLLLKTNKHLYSRRVLWLLSEAESKNLLTFIPFKTFRKFILQNKLFTNNTSPEALWNLCIKFGKNRVGLTAFNGSKPMINNKTATNQFLRKCAKDFEFDTMNVSFFMDHVLSLNFLDPYQQIDILKKHIRCIRSVVTETKEAHEKYINAPVQTSYNRYNNNNNNGFHNGFRGNHHNSYKNRKQYNNNNDVLDHSAILNKLDKFDKYKFTENVFNKIGDPYYFRKIYQMPQHSLSVPLDLNVLKLSVFDEYFTSYHSKKTMELIKNEMPKMTDVIFEIDYDEKTDDRMDLTSIYNEWKYKEREDITTYNAIFSLFAIQSNKFKELMKEYYFRGSSAYFKNTTPNKTMNKFNPSMLNQPFKIKENIRPSTFRFLRDYIYGKKKERKITPYNVLDLYCFSYKYGLTAICDACLEQFAYVQLYELPAAELLAIVICFDCFASSYKPRIELISEIFKKCPKFSLRRVFDSDHGLDILRHLSLYKLSIDGFEEFVFKTGKFKNVDEESLFLHLVNFVKRRTNSNYNAMQQILERIIEKYFKFGSDFDVFHFLKMMKQIKEGETGRISSLISKSYNDGLRKFLGKQQQKEKKRKVQEIEDEFVKTKFVIYDIENVSVHDDGKQIICTKNGGKKPEYLLCLSGSPYDSGRHFIKYKLNEIDEFLAIGISTVCNKMVKRGFGLYHKLGKGTEKEADLLDGKFVCVWSDGSLLKYVRQKQVLSKHYKAWNEGDTISVDINCKEWEVEFKLNKETIVEKVKLDEEQRYFCIVQVHTRSNHNIQVIEQHHFE